VPDLWSDLLGYLDFRPVPSGGTGAGRAGDDVTAFEGRHIACLSCPDKAVKSQPAVFGREGRADEPVRYYATCHHDRRVLRPRSPLTVRDLRF
jgi:acyl-CoA thioesterase-2